jgi:hypothetical protein
VVKEGTSITTGKNGFLTLAFPDESRVSIPSNSQVSLSKLRKTKYVASPRTEISLSEGKVESRVTSLSSNKDVLKYARLWRLRVCAVRISALASTLTVPRMKFWKVALRSERVTKDERTDTASGQRKHRRRKWCRKSR